MSCLSTLLTTQDALDVLKKELSWLLTSCFFSCLPPDLPVPKLLALGPPNITQWGWLCLQVALLVSSEGRGLRKRRISALNSSIVGGEGGSEIKAWFE